MYPNQSQGEKQVEWLSCYGSNYNVITRKFILLKLEKTKTLKFLLVINLHSPHLLTINRSRELFPSETKSKVQLRMVTAFERLKYPT